MDVAQINKENNQEEIQSLVAKVVKCRKRYLPAIISYESKLAEAEIEKIKSMKVKQVSNDDAVKHRQSLLKRLNDTLKNNVNNESDELDAQLSRLKDEIDDLHKVIQEGQLPIKISNEDDLGVRYIE